MARVWMCVLALIFVVGCTDSSKVSQCIGFGKDDTVFVINADDIGMHPDMDNAVFEMYEKEIVQTFSLMVPTPNFNFSARYAINNKVPVGLHLTLTNEWQEANSWTPLLSREEVPSLYNEKGYMWPTGEELAEHADIKEVRKELEAQIDKALEIGLEVTHLDFHMLYWAYREDFWDVTLNIAKHYKMPIVVQHHWMTQREQRSRTSTLQWKDFFTADVFWMYYNPTDRLMDENLSRSQYQNMFKDAKPALHHVAIHPAYRTESAKQQFRDAEFRFDEFRVWTDGSLNDAIKENGIKFTNYRELKRLMTSGSDCLK
ncbi:conserved hypothetical protein [Vibrio nigripulchritudo SO65]|uniref:polysaccharide deacetylase family protein n=1 Tax=Vibrio nigripulchritudo TaxID=28173 RepID=UPI0003B220B2|nr:polysaccharide deacetylase family protein [Vibrio nigripulchritudo]CCN37566.1 conserved hypothetical protein [Vibrio nigripulchritudo AM115]CCN39572.1 conserved hypothetical protein [Vibrio nigripulchritudo FTn2]CCN66802.1 conserved hypothetical protein [Vibrio nigripulchritudo POn4]CCN75672.1 conserved hypothetical protein [Vibrio nigripulchritudo SO65]